MYIYFFIVCVYPIHLCITNIISKCHFWNNEATSILASRLCLLKYKNCFIFFLKYSCLPILFIFYSSSGRLKTWPTKTYTSGYLLHFHIDISAIIFLFPALLWRMKYGIYLQNFNALGKKKNPHGARRNVFFEALTLPVQSTQNVKNPCVEF